MIVRVVKMVFKEEEIPAFEALFQERKHLIRNFEGCTHLELWQDKANRSQFFTYSHWDTEEHLNAYRGSSFFDDTWTLTKQKFAAKPEAWTIQTIWSL